MCDTVTENSNEIWKPFFESSPFRKSGKANNGYAPLKKSQPKNDGSDDAEEYKSEKESNSEAKSSNSKSVKRNKWKEEEVKKLIGMRRELNGKFQGLNGRMVLWEEISKNLLDNGISRNPGQCKSMWTSLIQKYEVCLFF